MVEVSFIGRKKAWHTATTSDSSNDRLALTEGHIRIYPTEVSCLNIWGNGHSRPHLPAAAVNPGFIFHTNKEMRAVNELLPNKGYNFSNHNLLFAFHRAYNGTIINWIEMTKPRYLVTLQALVKLYAVRYFSLSTQNHLLSVQRILSLFSGIPFAEACVTFTSDVVMNMKLNMHLLSSLWNLHRHWDVSKLKQQQYSHTSLQFDTHTFIHKITSKNSNRNEKTSIRGL